MRSILITGAAGFIGSHLADALLERGDVVTAYDSFAGTYGPERKLANIAAARQHPNYTLIHGDIRDSDLLTNVLRTGQPDTIVHLAALAGVRPSVDDPSSYMDVNVTGTSVVLDAAVRTGVRNIVVASSSSVYGAAHTPPFTEDMPPLFPASPYAASKCATELVTRTAAQLHDLDVSLLRFFTVYGPRQRPDMAIHIFANRLATGQPLQVFGDGSQLRDFTYVDDIIGGVTAAMDRPNGVQVFNLGSTHAVKLVDCIQLLARHMNVNPAIRFLDPVRGDVPVTLSDVRLARTHLDYHPQVTLDDGLSRFVRWFIQQHPSRIHQLAL